MHVELGLSAYVKPRALLLRSLTQPVQEGRMGCLALATGIEPWPHSSVTARAGAAPSVTVGDCCHCQQTVRSFRPTVGIDSSQENQPRRF